MSISTLFKEYGYCNIYIHNDSGKKNPQIKPLMRFKINNKAHKKALINLLNIKEINHIEESNRKNTIRIIGFDSMQTVLALIQTDSKLDIFSRFINSRIRSIEEHGFRARITQNEYNLAYKFNDYD